MLINTQLMNYYMNQTPWEYRGEIRHTPFSKYNVVNIYNGEREGKCHLDVPFLITTDHDISNHILGFNVIKHIAQTTNEKLLMKLFETSLDQTQSTTIVFALQKQ